MSNEQQHTRQPGKSDSAGKEFAELISDFLFRWRRWILLSVLVIVAGVITWGAVLALASRQRQQVALAVYELRQAFQDWKDAHPADILTARKNLEEQDSADGLQELDIDEESQKKAAETEQALTELIQKSLSSSQGTIQAWAYWIEGLKARQLKDTPGLQVALENLVLLQDKTFTKLARLQLAGLLYDQGKSEEAVQQWHELADINGPEPEQIVASIYLANYFARNGNKEEAIRYWQQVQSLGNELLQANGLDDEKSFLGGENQIAGSFRSFLEQWNTMADNQLLFLQSDKIQLPADGYDESIEPGIPAEAAQQDDTGNQSFSFTTAADEGISPFAPGSLPGTIVPGSATEDDSSEP